MKLLIKLFIYLLVALLFVSCLSVEAYQKVYLNDVDMQMKTKSIDKFDVEWQIYREASSGGQGSSSGGGCGCN